VNIVRRYAVDAAWIVLVQLPAHQQRSFASQAYALNEGLGRARDQSYAYLSCLDADITLPEDYFERLIGRLEQRPELGLAGGWIVEPRGRRYLPSPFNTSRNVPGALQMFRKACLDQIGPFVPLKYGGLDTYHELRARVAGWEAESFEDLPVLHHRPTGRGDRALRSTFRSGLRDFTLGYHPLYATLAALRRVRDPFAFAPVIRIAGFLAGWLTREPRGPSRAEMKFLRAEQMRRVAAFVVGS
jgi:poly-beta-1,6-N-acetyl-D-glucosamine synthase